jgi:S1-C subfamily serine protease
VIHAPDDSTLNLKGGDVILSVDGRTPMSQPQLIRILRSYAPGETLRLDIMRHQHRMTVTAKIPERHPPHDGMDFDWQPHGIMR